MKTDADTLAQATKCPKGHATAICFFGSTHLRWCLYCKCYWTVVYNKRKKVYQRSKITKGVPFSGESL